MAERTDAAGAPAVEIQALAVAGEILDFLASAGARRSAAEIARELGMTPPRVWRHLNSLEALGFVEGGADRGFVLGGRLARLGQRAMDGIELTEVAHAPLGELRDELVESVYLAVPGGGGATVVISLDAGGPISLHLALGVVFDWHASAAGRVLLAFSSDERRKQVLDAGTLTDTGHHPITDRRELASRLEAIHDRFYDTAETAQVPRTSGIMHLNAIAAPVFDHTNGVAGAVGVLTGIAGEVAISSPTIVNPLFGCVAKISEAMGSTRWSESGALPG
ncbi:IclR family transcriptional regulator [Gordonia sp. NPDC003376]